MKGRKSAEKVTTIEGLATLVSRKLGETDMKVHKLAALMMGEFGRVDGRLDTMDARFDSMDGRLDKIDAQLDSIDERIASIVRAAKYSDGTRYDQHAT